MFPLIAAAAAGLWALSRRTPNGRGLTRPGAANYSEQANAPAAPADENVVLNEVADSVFGNTEDAPIVVNDGKR